MSRKKSKNQPIVAEEPARPDEQFRMDQSEVAPPSARPRPAGSSGVKTYGARSARDRRTVGTSTPTTTRRTDSGRSSASRRERVNKGLRADVVSNMLEHPTIVVTEDDLRKEYGYVVSDLRSMAITAVALIAALVVLAQLLPK